jgi:hypothetical protein
VSATSTTPIATIAAAIAAAVGAAPALAGCGGGPSCDKAIARAAALRQLDELDARHAIERCKDEGWSEAVRSCIAGAGDEDALARCAARSQRSRSGGAFESYMARSKRSEAELELNAISKALRAEFIENASFVVGDVGLTPATPCCEGPGHKCPVTASDWTGVDVWDRLGFELTRPSYFQYRYTGTMSEATAEAVGDLDCDGVTATYTLHCRAADGVPECTLRKPARAD